MPRHSWDLVAVVNKWLVQSIGFQIKEMVVVNINPRSTCSWHAIRAAPHKLILTMNIRGLSIKPTDVQILIISGCVQIRSCFQWSKASYRSSIRSAPPEIKSAVPFLVS